MRCRDFTGPRPYNPSVPITLDRPGAVSLRALVRRSILFSRYQIPQYLIAISPVCIGTAPMHLPMALAAERHQRLDVFTNHNAGAIVTKALATPLGVPPGYWLEMLLRQLDNLNHASDRISSVFQFLEHWLLLLFSLLFPPQSLYFRWLIPSL